MRMLALLACLLASSLVRADESAATATGATRVEATMAALGKLALQIGQPEHVPATGETLSVIRRGPIEISSVENYVLVGDGFRDVPERYLKKTTVLSSRGDQGGFQLRLEVEEHGGVRGRQVALKLTSDSQSWAKVQQQLAANGLELTWTPSKHGGSAIARVEERPRKEDDGVDVGPAWTADRPASRGGVTTVVGAGETMCDALPAALAELADFGSATLNLARDRSTTTLGPYTLTSFVRSDGKGTKASPLESSVARSLTGPVGKTGLIMTKMAHATTSGKTVRSTATCELLTRDGELHDHLAALGQQGLTFEVSELRARTFVRVSIPTGTLAEHLKASETPDPAGKQVIP